MALSTYALRQRLQEKAPLLGTLQALPATEVTEMLMAAGFQWLWVDMEHSPIEIHSMQRILQTAQNACHCIVRTPSHDEIWFKKILDAGADGIIVPQVRNAEEVERLMQFCKYPPMGKRSVGLARAQGYGNRFVQYVANANEEVAVVLQIEHIDAVRNIDSIIAVPGVDAVIVGPYDLSASMGKTGQVNDPEVQEKVEHVRRVCLDANMTLGIFTTQPDEVETLAKKGYRLICLGVDTMFLGAALKDALKNVKLP